MKFSSIVCASVVVLSGFALTVDGASAASQVTQHSNGNNNDHDANCSTGQTAASNTTARNSHQDGTITKQNCGNPDSSRSSVMPSVGGLGSGTVGNGAPTPTPATATPLNNRSNVDGAAQPTDTPATTPPTDPDCSTSQTAAPDTADKTKKAIDHPMGEPSTANQADARGGKDRPNQSKCMKM